MGGTYPKLKDYDELAFDPKDTIIALACCDCGLVHEFKVRVTSKRKVGMAMRRNNRATGQLRRHDYGNLQRDAEKYKMVRTEG